MKPRPKSFDPEVLQEVAGEVTPKVIELLNWEESDFSEVRDAIAKALASHADGYKLASSLERTLHIEADFALAEVLENIGFRRHNVWQKCLKEWVNQFDVKLTRKVNDPVQITHYGKLVLGTIIKLNEETATYVVMCPSLGHSPDGPKLGQLVPAEEVFDPPADLA